METNIIPAWHYIWKCLYWWPLLGCQISCLYSKSADSTEILGYAAGLYGTIMEILSLSRRRSSARNVPSGEVVRRNGCFCRPAIIGSTPLPLRTCYTITLTKSFVWRPTKHKQLVASLPKDFVGKKQTNKNLCSLGNSLRNLLCLNFWIIWCKVSFLTQYIEWIIVSFDISVVKVFFLRVQHLIHGLVYQFSHSVQSEEEKRILKQKMPLERTDNDITKTDYKGKKKKQ